MKKLYSLLFISVAILFITSYVSYSQTSVPGGTVSGNWTLAGSPYQVQGSIQIPNGQVLTIDPGVTVDFQGHYKFIVLGQLIAIGTSVDSIHFTASNTVTGWYGIRFDQTLSANDTSKLKYCSIRWGKANGSAYDSYGGGFFIRDFSKLIISHNLIKDNTSTIGGGFYLNNTTAAISYNTIVTPELFPGLSFILLKEHPIR